ncbi:uncharacterized protein si:dkey-260g12.1 isoform X2 [Hoplias malabaricus]|uniref:uncharacterized protein si:dkey-260g12.1 isoform X2 n=1 Tax=Hoplias malabaricus TaxID=27720 RepID=UPI00346278E4
MWVLLVIVIMMDGLTSALPLKPESTNVRVRRTCKTCLKGEYLENCNKCSKCSDGSYTSEDNTERSCHPCYRNCIPDLNMQVVKNCTHKSDVVCRCMAGFSCSMTDSFTGHCTKCVEDHVYSTALVSHSTTVPTTLHHRQSHTTMTQRPKDIQNPWVVVIVVVFGVLSLVLIILHVCRQRKKECLKKWVMRCSPGNQKGDTATPPFQISEQIKQVHAEELSPHTPISTINSTDCSNTQPASTEQPLPTNGNLGPLHIYGAGTVFVSLLNQFGQNGGEKDEEDLQQRCANKMEVNGPTSPLPLSTEERNRDSGYISFPFQEQGKECHMSKEEGL